MRSSRGPVSGTVLLALLWGGPLGLPAGRSVCTAAESRHSEYHQAGRGAGHFPGRHQQRDRLAAQLSPARPSAWLPSQDFRRGTDPGIDQCYKLADFQCLFGTDGAAAFTGTGQRVANNTEELPKVFGSVRAYFKAVSGGRFSLQVRIINPQDARGYPRWVQLPETRGYYADLPRRASGTGASNTDYWDDAYDAAQDSIGLWYPGSTEYDLPGPTADVNRRRRHKVVYLYSGVEYHFDEPRTSVLHPHADETAVTDPTTSIQQRPEDIGFRYVAGERRGTDPRRFTTWTVLVGLGYTSTRSATCWASRDTSKSTGTA